MILLLILVSVGMFGFTFGLVPFYSVFCKITGINGKMDLRTQALGRYESPQSLKGHVITLELDTNLHPNLPFDFFPENKALQVIPGTLYQTYYVIKNKTNQTHVVKAVPSISPGILAKHLKKLECFCFTEQVIKPKEVRRVPLRFWLEPEFPESIHRLTLSYTLFDITKNPKE